jgi:hypothetical protein
MQVKPNCFEKTKVRWGIFKKLSFTNVDLEHVRPLATNSQIDEQTLRHDRYVVNTLRLKVAS